MECGFYRPLRMNGARAAMLAPDFLSSWFRTLGLKVGNTTYNFINETSPFNDPQIPPVGQNEGLSFVPIGPSRALAIGVTEVRSGSCILAIRFVIVLTYTTLQPSTRT